MLHDVHELLVQFRFCACVIVYMHKQLFQLSAPGRERSHNQGSAGSSWLVHALTRAPCLSTPAAQQYRYIAELLKLDSMVPATLLVLPPELTEVSSPLNVQAWISALSDHPDRVFASFIGSGLSNSFRIGNIPPNRLDPTCPQQLSTLT